jgi:hypothetical protein
MAMVGFLQAQNCTNLPNSWRHPESRDDSMSADYYQEIAGVLEAGKFHMAFLDDRLAMPDRYGNDHAHTVEYGIRCVKMDPVIVLTTHPGCKYRQDRARYRGLRECAERQAASCYRPMSRLPLIATSLSRSRRGTICRRCTTSVRSSRPVGSCLTESTSPMCFAKRRRFEGLG